VEQVLGLSPEETASARILEDYSTFMKGLVSLPLNIPGTPYARAIEVRFAILHYGVVSQSCTFIN
jgi:cytochrome P450 family 724 subfamily B polypeptide 1